MNILLNQIFYFDIENLNDCNSTRREMVHYRQEENLFVKILLTQNEYRLESNVFLSSQKIKFWG